jgi:hypothetical protein
MNFDFTVTFSVILGISAVVAPVITTKIKSQAEYNLKKLELENAENQRQTQRIIEIFDAYVIAAGRCSAYSSPENIAAFGAASAKAELYAPAEILPKMQQFSTMLTDPEYYEGTVELLSEITKGLRTVVKI